MDSQRGSGAGFHPLAWAGVILLAVGALAWFVFQVTIYIAIALFAAGLVLIGWGSVKAKGAITDAGDARPS